MTRTMEWIEHTRHQPGSAADPETGRGEPHSADQA